jgi:hypothetical protein
VADRNGSCPQQFGLWEPKTPLTIAPTKTYDEMVRLLRECETQLQEAIEKYQGENWQASAQEVAHVIVPLRALLATLEVKP